RPSLRLRPRDPDRIEEVADLKRLPEEGEPLRDLADEAGEKAGLLPEPGPGARNGVRLLKRGPPLFLADEPHEAADRVFGGPGIRLAGDRVFSKDDPHQIVPPGPLRQTGDRQKERLPDEPQNIPDKAADKLNNPVDRPGEDPLRPAPDAAEIEEVGEVDRVEETVDPVAEGIGGQAEAFKLLREPRSDRLDKVAPLERLEDQVPPRQKPDRRARQGDGVSFN